MKIQTVGSELFLGDVNASVPVLAFGCITAISGLGGPAGQVDVSCWRDRAGRSVQGRAAPGTVTVSGIYETDDETFIAANELRKTGAQLAWAIGGADADEGTAPELNSAGEFDGPDTRTWLVFNGYIADITWDLQDNNVWRWQIQIQRDGDWDILRKAASA